jgi:AcrR family transcriptional regulator
MTTHIRHAKRPRWQRRKEARPGEIVSAALDLFVERGFAVTKLDDVARRAGVTKGTMYLYFDSKEALFKAVVREAVVPTIERGEQLIAGHQGSARELLAELIRGWWAVIGDSRVSGLPKLMVSEAANFPELARFYHEEVVLRGRQVFSRALERGIASGEFRKVDVLYALRSIVFAIMFAAVWKHSIACHEAETFDFERFINSHIDVVLRGILAEPREERSHA